MATSSYDKHYSLLSDYVAEYPPSIFIVVPVQNLFVAKYKAAEATSSTVPNR